MEVCNIEQINWKKKNSRDKIQWLWTNNPNKHLFIICRQLDLMGWANPVNSKKPNESNVESIEPE